MESTESTFYEDPIEFQFNYQYDEMLLDLLDRLEELHKIRRENTIDQKFWNQFWHRWDFYKLRDAYQQAFKDMAADIYFKVNWEFVGLSNGNFEKVVASDIHKFKDHVSAVLLL